MKNERKQSLAVLLLHVPSELQFRIGDPSKPWVHSPKPNEPAAVCWNIAFLKKSDGQKSWSQVPDTVDQLPVALHSRVTNPSKPSKHVPLAVNRLNVYGHVAFPCVVASQAAPKSKKFRK